MLLDWSHSLRLNGCLHPLLSPQSWEANSSFCLPTGMLLGCILVVTTASVTDAGNTRSSIFLSCSCMILTHVWLYICTTAEVRSKLSCLLMMRHPRVSLPVLHRRGNTGYINVLLEDWLHQPPCSSESHNDFNFRFSLVLCQWHFLFALNFIFCHDWVTVLT